MNIPLPPTGSELACKGWHQEAALRCLLNNLHPEVAEDRDELIVYGGNGQAARNPKALNDIINALKILKMMKHCLCNPVNLLQLFQVIKKGLVFSSPIQT